MSKVKSEMTALLGRQSEKIEIQDTREIPDEGYSNQEPKNSINQESKNSRKQEVKKSRAQENKISGSQEFKKSRIKESKKTKVTIDKSGATRRPANITLCDDVKEALDILAVKRRVRPWKLLDQALRVFLAKEGIILDTK